MRKKRRKNKMRNAILKVVLLLVILGGLTLYGIKIYVTHIAPMKPRLDSQVLDAEKTYKIHPIKYDAIPKIYRQAVIATEDRRFWWDPGIDPIGIGRSIVVDVTKQRYAQGGSTITQQLVDNTFLKRRKSLTYKIEQTLYAIGIYDTIPKKTVFEMYANIIYFGNGAYGLYNASETYFNKTPNQLNDGELTLLAGLPNSPNNFDPLLHLQAAKARQAAVVQNMVDMGIITKDQATTILKEPLRLVKKG